MSVTEFRWCTKHRMHLWHKTPWTNILENIWTVSRCLVECAKAVLWYTEKQYTVPTQVADFSGLFPQASSFKNKLENKEMHDIQQAVQILQIIVVHINCKGNMQLLLLYNNTNIHILKPFHSKRVNCDLSFLPCVQFTPTKSPNWGQTVLLGPFVAKPTWAQSTQPLHCVQISLTRWKTVGAI